MVPESSTTNLYISSSARWIILQRETGWMMLLIDAWSLITPGLYWFRCLIRFMHRRGKSMWQCVYIKMLLFFFFTQLHDSTTVWQLSSRSYQRHSNTEAPNPDTRHASMHILFFSFSPSRMSYSSSCQHWILNSSLCYYCIPVELPSLTFNDATDEHYIAVIRRYSEAW